MARVVVGMSGGVDSSVAAWLLKKEGHEVIGLFMRNWNEASATLEDECPWVDDSRDAMMVAEQLGIPFQVMDLSEVYKARIVDYMFSEYAAGRTPNPDVLCNREIKFDVFLKAALKLGADYVATGHYVQKETTQVNGVETYRLLSGADPNKDQSYFLCQLTQEQLKYSLFPIGGMLKPEVRKIAENAGLLTADKKDSQGLCFIGKISLPEFLQQQLKAKKGKVVEIDRNHPWFLEHPFDRFSENINMGIVVQRPVFTEEDGKVVGTHEGAHFYTIGQRKGLSIGGTPEALFVIQTDVKNNLVFVGQGADHPGLYSAGLKLDDAGMHWIRPDLMPESGRESRYRMKIRYRQQLFEGLIVENQGQWYVKFDSPQKAVTPGQFLAVYQQDELIGSGVIA